MGFFSKLFGSNKEKISTDELTEAYAGVAAGVEINRKCNLLSTSDSADLEDSLKQFTNLLVGRIDPDFLIMVIQTSKDLAEDAPYSQCGADAQDAIAEAQNVAAYWLDVLGKN